MSSSHPICLIMAVLLEAKPFVSGLGLELEGSAPFKVYGNENIKLVISGVGKVNAAMAAAYACVSFSPKTIINLGAAGALDTEHSVGEMYQIKSVVEYDRRTLKTNEPPVIKLETLEGFAQAVLVTNDIPILLSTEREKASEYANLVDMEGAAVVRTAEEFNIPCFLFKFISDDLNQSSETDFIENVKAYRSKFFSFFKDEILPLLL